MTRQEPAPARATTTTTPERIYDDFSQDPTGAEARYLGRQVRITGVPASVEADGLKFFRLGMDLVATCSFEPGERGPLRGLAKGRSVTVEGYGANRVSHHVVQFTGCRLVGSGPAPAQAAIPPRPPLGEYFCRAGGAGVGKMVLGASTYTASGLTGGYSFDPASRTMNFRTGAYANYGWTGRWEAGPPRPDGRADPRITLSEGGRERATCTPAS